MEVRELLADLNTSVAVIQADVKAGNLANHEAHERFAESLTTHTIKLETLDNSIRGNGGAGLNERMNVVEKDKDERDHLKRTIFVATIIAVVGAIITVVVAVITNIQTVQGATP